MSDISSADTRLRELLHLKLAVPSNELVDVSTERLTALRQQIDSRLKPVLRINDFNRFDLERVFEIVANLGRKL